jgi:trimethylamine--corrinoid protein Co-methyltransferase
VTSDHTFNHFRDGWFPEVVGDRNVYDKWVSEGSKTLGDRANEKVRQILETHEPKPLPDPVREKLDGIMADVKASVDEG